MKIIKRLYEQELGRVEQILKADRYLAPHYAFYVREMKIKAYAQVGMKNYFVLLANIKESYL